MASGQIRRATEYLRESVFPRDGGPRSDGELLEAFLAGRDEAAFAALVRRHGPMVLGVCRRVLRHAHDAEDAFQAVFLVLVRRGASVVPRDMVGPWLYGVAYRTALEAKGALAKRRAREKQIEGVPHPAVSPGEPLSELRPVLDRELSRLPAKYRVPLVLCYLEGRTRKDVARRLGLPEGTLSNRLAAGRKLLARRLTRRGVCLSAGAPGLELARQAAPGAVPAALRAAVVRAGFAAATRGTAGGLVAAHVDLLAGRVAKTMLLTRLAVAVKTSLLLAGALALAGGAVVYRSAAASDDVPAAAAAQPPTPEAPRKPGTPSGAPAPGDPNASPGGPAVSDPFFLKGERQRDRERDEEARLQGTWKVSGLVVDGRERFPPATAAEWRFRGKKVMIWSALPGNKSPWHDFSMNPAKATKELNVFGNNLLIQAIYRLEGDTLTVAYYARPEVDRPASFTPGKDAPFHLSVWTLHRVPSNAPPGGSAVPY